MLEKLYVVLKKSLLFQALRCYLVRYSCYHWESLALLKYSMQENFLGKLGLLPHHRAIQLLRRAGGPGIIQSEQPAFMITAWTSKHSVIPLVVYRIWRALTRQINRKNFIINMLSEQVQQFSNFNFQCPNISLNSKLWKC